MNPFFIKPLQLSTTEYNKDVIYLFIYLFLERGNLKDNCNKNLSEST